MMIAGRGRDASRDATGRPERPPQATGLPHGWSILPNMSLSRGFFTRRFLAVALIAGTSMMAQAQQPGTPGNAQAPPTGPVYVVTHVDIIGTAQRVADAITLMHDFQAASLGDAGAVRFEVLQQDSRLNHFVMSEVWQSREAYDAHNGLEHARKFREKLGPMLGSPFDVRLHRLLP
jgi:quinol monooxygenase YgiN